MKKPLLFLLKRNDISLLFDFHLFLGFYFEQQNYFKKQFYIFRSHRIFILALSNFEIFLFLDYFTFSNFKSDLHLFCLSFVGLVFIFLVFSSFILTQTLNFVLKTILFLWYFIALDFMKMKDKLEKIWKLNIMKWELIP